MVVDNCLGKLIELFLFHVPRSLLGVLLHVKLVCHCSATVPVFQISFPSPLNLMVHSEMLSFFKICLLLVVSSILLHLEILSLCGHLHVALSMSNHAYASSTKSAGENAPK